MSARLRHHAVTAPAAAGGHAPPHGWLVVLHGIFGWGRNWASIARRLVERRADWGVLLVDLREHGDSVGFDPPHTLAASAADVRSLVESLGIARHAVLGHSFGGKVALRYAADRPGGLEQVWVIDSSPDALTTRNQGHMMLKVLRRLPERFDDRDAAIAAMASFGVSSAVAQWMAGNLVRDESAGGGAMRWRFKLDDIAELLDDFYPATFWDQVEAAAPPAEIHFVKAASSDLLSDQAAKRIESAPAAGRSVFLHRVAGDHWLNVSNPDALVDLLIARL